MHIPNIEARHMLIYERLLHTPEIQLPHSFQILLGYATST